MSRFPLYVVIFALPIFEVVTDYIPSTIVLLRNSLYSLSKGIIHRRKHAQPDFLLLAKIKSHATTLDQNGVVNNVSATRFAPQFKFPAKMYKIEVKPAGNMIKFRCNAKGNPDPNITWYRNHTSDMKRVLSKPTFGKWFMTLEELTTHDNGKYTCKVCNDLGCIQHSTMLTVLERYPAKPYIKDGYPENKTIIVNDNVTFNCPIISDLEPTINWLWEANNSHSFIIESQNLEDNHEEQLTLLNVSLAREGWYTCLAENSIGSFKSKGYLKVLKSQPRRGRQDQDNLNISQSMVLSIVCFIIILLISLMIITVIMKKLKREKLKKRLAVETTRVLMAEQWAKIVTIKGNTESNNKLIIPNVSIEKVRFCELPQEINKPGISSEYILPVDTKWEVAKENFTIGKVLGEGEFGKVVKAECTKTPNTSLPCTVAVKMLKEGHSDADMLALVSEMEIMKMIGKHENIINLLGCCTLDGPLYVVVEYAQNGSLRDYLKKHKPYIKKSSEENLLHKPLTQQELMDFALQIAKGMAYLSSRGCIHRDLAARNVLVSGARVLKVADFGLARDVRDADYYRKRTAGKLPVRWMAPESLCHNYYTTKSDVWSFGILTWEIVTYGCTPYPNVYVNYLYEYLKSGRRMAKPDDCSEDLYTIMIHCWNFRPDDRPEFAGLVDNIHQMINTLTDTSATVFNKNPHYDDRKSGDSDISA